MKETTKEVMKERTAGVESVKSFTETVTFVLED